MQISQFFLSGDIKGAIAYMRDHEEFKDILPAYVKKSEPIPKWEVFGFSNSAFVNEQAGANASACFAINISFFPAQLDGYNVVTVLKERKVIPIRN